MIGFNISASSVNRATNFALNSKFKSMGVSGNFEFSRYLVTSFLCSEEI